MRTAEKVQERFRQAERDHRIRDSIRHRGSARRALVTGLGHMHLAEEVTESQRDAARAVTEKTPAQGRISVSRRTRRDPEYREQRSQLVEYYAHRQGNLLQAEVLADMAMSLDPDQRHDLRWDLVPTDVQTRYATIFKRLTTSAKLVIRGAQAAFENGKPVKSGKGGQKNSSPDINDIPEYLPLFNQTSWPPGLLEKATATIRDLQQDRANQTRHGDERPFAHGVFTPTDRTQSVEADDKSVKEKTVSEVRPATAAPENQVTIVDDRQKTTRPKTIPTITDSSDTNAVIVKADQSSKAETHKIGTDDPVPQAEQITYNQTRTEPEESAQTEPDNNEQPVREHIEESHATTDGPDNDSGYSLLGDDNNEIDLLRDHEAEQVSFTRDEHMISEPGADEPDLSTDDR